MAQNNSIFGKLIDPQLSALKSAFDKWGVKYNITPATDDKTKRKITKITVMKYGKNGKTVEGSIIFKDGPKMFMNVRSIQKKSVNITAETIPELLQKYSVTTGKEIYDIDRFVQDIALIENKPEETPDYSHFDDVDQIKNAIMQRTKKTWKTKIIDGELVYDVNKCAKFGIYPLKNGKLRVDIYKWEPSKDGLGFTTIYDLSFIVTSEQVVSVFNATMNSSVPMDKEQLLDTYADKKAGPVFDSHLKYDGQIPLSAERKSIKDTAQPGKATRKRKKKEPAEIIKEEPVPIPEPDDITDETESDEDERFENPNSGDTDIDDEDEGFSDDAIL